MYLGLRDLNFGPQYSGLCRIAPSPWAKGYFDVTFHAFHQGEGLPDVQDRPDVQGGLHYSMAFPLQTPVRLLRWHDLIDPQPLMTVLAYFHRLGTEQYGNAPTDLWLPERRADIARLAETICSSRVDTILDVDQSEATSVITADVTLTRCTDAAPEGYVVQVELLRSGETWQIAAIRAAP